MNRRGFLKLLGLAPVAAVAAAKAQPKLDDLIDQGTVIAVYSKLERFPAVGPTRDDHTLDTMRYFREADDRRRGKWGKITGITAPE